MSRSWLIGGSVIVVALVITSIVLVLLQTETEFALNSPEGTVQAYLRALEQDQPASAYSLLSSQLAEACPLEDFVTDASFSKSQISEHRVILLSTQVVNGTTIVTVRLSRVTNSGPFGVSESSYDEGFSLKNVAGSWRISKEPWPFFHCGNKPDAKVNPPVPDS